MRRITRRDAFKLGIVGGAALLLPSGLIGERPQIPIAHAWGDRDDDGQSPPVTPFQSLLPVPPVLSPVVTPTADAYTITMRQAQVSIIPGLTTTIWGYNGLFPGPTIRAKVGRAVTVKQVNQLPENTAVHLHGGHQSAPDDGFPIDYIPPGGSRDYYYPNTPFSQRGTTLWYHDHAMDFTGRNVYEGLAGFYILEDDFEIDLQNRRLIPRGLAGAVPVAEAHDIPLVIQDRTFRSDGSLYYPGGSDAFEGDRLLVNGAVQPRFEVSTRKYRLRILNGSNGRYYTLSLSTGQSFVQIGTEGGFLPKPVTRTSIRLAPAERADVIVDFSGYPVGTRVTLKNSDYSIADIMRFDVTRSEQDDVGQVPNPLRPLQSWEVLQAGQAVQTRSFSFERDRDWVINGRPFDPNRIDASPRLGSVEIWKLINDSWHDHPVHIHLDQFQILDRNGKAPAAYEAGWKDTVNLGRRDTVRVLIKFTDFTGRYVFHCHILEHEDRYMMSRFDVV